MYLSNLIKHSSIGASCFRHQEARRFVRHRRRQGEHERSRREDPSVRGLRSVGRHRVVQQVVDRHRQQMNTIHIYLKTLIFNN